MNTSLFSKCTAEFIGTFVLIFAGCGSIAVASAYPLTSLNTPVIFGLAVMTMIYAVGHISGAHFNPAVTVAFTLGKHFSPKQTIPYVFSQFSGAFAGILLLKFLLPEATDFGATIPTVDLLRAFIWEVLLTFILMFVIVSVATDARAEGLMAGTAIGATVALCAWLGGAITGASMNPARTLAPNALQGEWAHLFVYLVAPIVGATLAAFTYNKIRCLESETNNDTAGGCC